LYHAARKIGTQAPSEKPLEPNEFEVQLKVWKELAISKQVLMQTATKALGLPAECSAQELEKALTETIAKGKNAAIEIKAAEEKAAAAISAMENKVKLSEKSKLEAIEARAAAEKDKEAADNKLIAGRAASAEDVKKAKAQMNDALKEMKRINKLLADSPENVVKKLKQLKKEKMEESNDRKRAEEVSRNLRKEKQKAEQKVDESKFSLEQAAELVVKYRELQKLANEQYDKLAETVKDKKELEMVPVFDEQILEAIEAAAPKADDKDAEEDQAKKDAKKETKKKATKKTAKKK
jgi:colicin import membrane protein